MAEPPLWPDRLPPVAGPGPGYSLTVSISAVQAWQRCQQRYAYRYVEGLKPRVSAWQAQLGVLIHEYLAVYYGGLHDGRSAAEAHALGLLALHSHREEYAATVNLLLTLGDEVQAAEFSAVLDRAGVLAHRYHDHRGRRDAERYEVLWVEREFRVPLTTSILSMGYADLITRDRETGFLGLWEHKSTQNLPPSSHRLRDLQTGVYGAMMHWLDGESPAEYVWNYVRTKLPTKPNRLAGGRGMTRRNDLDTTWDTYEAALIEEGLDPARYEDIRERLLRRNDTHWFPRFVIPQMVDHAVLIRDYSANAREMLAHRRAWAGGQSQPIRAIARDCDWCPYLRLCEAVLTSGDPESIIAERFVRVADTTNAGEWNDRASDE